MKILPKTTFQVHNIIKSYQLFNWFHSFNLTGKILLILSVMKFTKTKMNIYKIGEVETKSWSNTGIDTKIFFLRFCLCN